MYQQLIQLTKEEVGVTTRLSARGVLFIQAFPRYNRNHASRGLTASEITFAGLHVLTDMRTQVCRHLYRLRTHTHAHGPYHAMVSDPGVPRAGRVDAQSRQNPAFQKFW